MLVAVWGQSCGRQHGRAGARARARLAGARPVWGRSVPGGSSSWGGPAGLESGRCGLPGVSLPRARSGGQRHSASVGQVPEVEELLRRLAEATQREEVLTRKLDQAEGVRWELEEALRVCEGRQSQLQTQLMTLKTEMDEARAQGTQMGAENGALTGVLGRKRAGQV
ncbi:coiled-coil domain-containing protein 194 [Pteropus medius]|uniref:coiled-coil domain-containing protein 194 n=1 Tax=Pteropus vampyrus TaxID=132908 RepID=UPI00196A72D6|nr:coiled-coil domain-containing protein 194 [Pteropus giganteus]